MGSADSLGGTPRAFGIGLSLVCSGAKPHFKLPAGGLEVGFRCILRSGGRGRAVRGGNFPEGGRPRRYPPRGEFAPFGGVRVETLENKRFLFSGGLSDTGVPYPPRANSYTTGVSGTAPGGSEAEVGGSVTG